NTSTKALANQTLPYVLRLAGAGLKALSADPTFLKGLNTHAGKLTQAGVGDAFDISVVEPASALSGAAPALSCSGAPPRPPARRPAAQPPRPSPGSRGNRGPAGRPRRHHLRRPGPGEPRPRRPAATPAGGRAARALSARRCACPRLARP